MTSPISGIDAAPVCSGEPKEPGLTENARRVLEARYLKKNEAGECIEQPDSLYWRVARTVADVEPRYGASESQRQRWERAYYELMAGGDFLPN